MTKFRMSDLGEILYFIGMKIEVGQDQISLSQSAYIKKVLSKFYMEDCKSVNTHLPKKLDYEMLNSDEIYNAPCRNLIVSLLYIMLCTRPNIITAINILSRYTNKNNIELWKCLKRVLRYLKGNINIKLIFKKNLNFENM